MAGKFEDALAKAADTPWARAYVNGRAAERRGHYEDAERLYREADSRPARW